MRFTDGVDFPFPQVLQEVFLPGEGGRRRLPAAGQARADAARHQGPSMKDVRYNVTARLTQPINIKDS